jgi:hypothetical protein
VGRRLSRQSFIDPYLAETRERVQEVLVAAMRDWTRTQRHHDRYLESSRPAVMLGRCPPPRPIGDNAARTPRLRIVGDGQQRGQRRRRGPPVRGTAGRGFGDRSG